MNPASSHKIVVVGAGPAGMMAAIRAAQLKQEVVLIEKNPFPGKKLLLSGKGRCNLTNICNLDFFLSRFSGNTQFLRNAFTRFFHQDLLNFFAKRGLKLKVERQNRVFPQTDKADSVLKVLKEELARNKVKIIYKKAVRDILKSEGRVSGVLLDVDEFIFAERVILATGGVSFSFTGSSGEGLRIARHLGHHIISLKPGLVPLETKETLPRLLLAGLTLKNIRLKFSAGRKIILSDIGELLFTPFGISGPLVLSLSGQVVDLLMQHKEVSLEIDLKPALSREQLEKRLLREFKENAPKSIKNTFKNLLPGRLGKVFLQLLKINPQKKTNQISKTERQAMISLVKGFSLTIARSRPIQEAMVTRGGVSLKEINPATMESRLIKGLYFAGEIIDIAADTGGFNLQAAFSTGYLAGESAALN